MYMMKRAGVCLAMVCVLLLAGCAANSPEATTKAFFTAAAAGDTDAAIALVSFKGVSSSQMALAKSKVNAMLAGFKAGADSSGGLKSVEVTKVEQIDDTHAKVFVSLHLGDDTQKKTSAKVVLEDGRWLMQIG